MSAMAPGDTVGDEPHASAAPTTPSGDKQLAARDGTRKPESSFSGAEWPGCAWFRVDHCAWRWSQDHARRRRVEPYAQGGIAAAIDRDDSPRLHAD